DEEKNHRHEVWIAKEDNKPPKHSGQSKVESSEYGSSSEAKQQPQEQQKEKKKPEAAVMHSVDEKNGFTARVGEDIRVAAHPQVSKITVGQPYSSAIKHYARIFQA